MLHRASGHGDPAACQEDIRVCATIYKALFHTNVIDVPETCSNRYGIIVLGMTDLFSLIEMEKGGEKLCIQRITGKENGKNEKYKKKLK